MNSSATIPSSLGVTTRVVSALGAILFGFGLFVATGFASPSTIHNATHDTRHALGLPCH